MTAPDPQRASTLPTLTWESVLDEGADAPELAHAAASPTTAPPAPPTPAATVPPPPPPMPSIPVAMSIGPLSLRVDALDDALAEPAAVEEFHLAITPLTFDASAAVTPVPAYQPVQPMGGNVLPLIREATPVQPYVGDESSVTEIPAIDIQAPNAQVTDRSVATTTVPSIAVTGPFALVAEPMLPDTQPAAINLPPAWLPDQSGGQPAPMVSPLAVEVPKRAKPSKRRVRRGLRLLVALAMIAGITGAAIFYGRPYLFPDDWEPGAKPSAMAVQDVVGEEFVEPVTVTAESSDMYTSRATDQLIGGWKPQVATWRALGLASGDPTEDVLVSLLDGWVPALYSRTDGQIYHDESVVGTKLEAELTQAMATALLDQRFGWDMRQSERTLDDAALVTAEVIAQSRTTQRSSEFGTSLEAGKTAPLAYLPPVLSYEVLAPAMYADLLALVDPNSPNPLEALGSAGPGPLAPDLLKTASAPDLADGDIVSVSATAKDRSFWYLALAGYLDAPTAYAASEAVVNSSLTVVKRSATTCAYLTFSGGDLIQTATLGSALESWVAAVPAEFTSAFNVLAHGGLQVVSCDPGAQAPGSARIGVARELVGWRSAEIATIIAVRQAGGGDPEIALALQRLALTDVGSRLAASSLELSPSESADAVRASVGTVVAPPPPPPADE